MLDQVIVPSEGHITQVARKRPHSCMLSHVDAQSIFTRKLKAAHFATERFLTSVTSHVNS